MSGQASQADPVPQPGLFDPEAFLAVEGERARFAGLVLGRYRAAGRVFPWRETRDPWAILVSEVMLQQTQTARVLPKYLAWMERFPRPEALAEAPFREVLALWSGLGYNRRALALARAASALAAMPLFPREEAALLDLPGVGSYTARAVLVFAFDRPLALLETNVRSVFIHHFFPAEDPVPDSRIASLAEAALASVLAAAPGEARAWNYALMDHGVEIKAAYGNPNRRSSAYARQSPFAGSNRRIRGALIREFGGTAELESGELEIDELVARLPFSAERVEAALAELVAEGFVEYGGEGERSARLCARLCVRLRDGP
jgi:A/G-specific adenine glycosylase